MTEHINEKRLSELAFDPALDARSEEDQHLSDCPQCVTQFVALLKIYLALATSS
jgi:hypothetical protein